MKDLLTNQLAKIFREYLQKELYRERIFTKSLEWNEKGNQLKKDTKKENIEKNVIWFNWEKSLD